VYAIWFHPYLPKWTPLDSTVFLQLK
jgi:hypothetical protein